MLSRFGPLIRAMSVHVAAAPAMPLLRNKTKEESFLKRRMIDYSWFGIGTKGSCMRRWVTDSLFEQIMFASITEPQGYLHKSD